MLDVEIPTTDGRLLQLTRYTQPDAAAQLLLQRLGKSLPDQPPRKLLPKQNRTTGKFRRKPPWRVFLCWWLPTSVG